MHGELDSCETLYSFVGLCCELLTELCLLLCDAKLSTEFSIQEVLHRVSTASPAHLCPEAFKTECNYALCNDCKPVTKRLRGGIHKGEQDSRKKSGWCNHHHPDDLICVTNSDTFTPTYYKKVQQRGGCYPSRCAGKDCLKKFIDVDEMVSV
jgi:hypothetical protein